MPVEVIMPKVDMDMASGIVARWHAREGDSVTQGNPLFDIETDKSTMEVEAPATGVLQQVMANSGDSIDIGVCIAQIFTDNESLEVATVQPDKQLLPADIKALEKADHKTISGKAKSTTPYTDVGPSPGSSCDMKVEHASFCQSEGVRATPVARKIAKQHRIALNTINGTGPRGRITKIDVLNAQEKPAATTTVSQISHGSLASKEKLDALGVACSVSPVERLRATIARRLTESKSTVPHFYLESDCHVDKLQAYRQDMNESLGTESTVRISMTDLIVMASAKALYAVPEANAAWAGNEIVKYQDANVSVAVSVTDGLMTPVLKGAQSKSIKQLSLELDDLSTRAKEGKLAQHEYQGGSMSVSNLGMYEVIRFKAIINPPESMILAVGAALQKVVVDKQGQPSVASVMSVCLSCDHRVLDGVIAARWLKAFKDNIENPIRLML